MHVKLFVSFRIEIQTGIDCSIKKTERSDTTILGTLGILDHFRHFSFVPKKGLRQKPTCVNSRLNHSISYNNYSLTFFVDLDLYLKS
jgi:hypothetical protein